MKIRQYQELNGEIRFEPDPDPEIEAELAPLRALVCLGKMAPAAYVMQYDKAGKRKHSNI
jgi:hypothetical protein